MGRTLSALSQIPQITIAAIDGACGGGGLELAVACDIRASGPGAEFSFPEVGLGLVPGGGGDAAAQPTARPVQGARHDRLR